MPNLASFRLSFTLNPLAYERRTIEQLEAFRFASTQKPHCLHIQIGDFGEVDRSAPGTIIQLSPDSIQMCGSNSADQSNRRRGIVISFFDP